MSNSNQSAALWGITLAFLTALCQPGMASTREKLELIKPGQLTICSYNAFEPEIYGEGQGFEADLLRSIAKRLQLKIQFVPISDYVGIWKLPLASQPQCDLVAGGLSKTPEREKDGVMFSHSFYHIQQSLLVRTADYRQGLRRYEDFVEGKQIIGVVPGTTGKEYAVQQVLEMKKDPKKLLKDYPSEKELLVALQKGEIQAIARGTPGNLFQASKNSEFTITGLRDFQEQFAFALNPKSKNLIKKVNELIPLATHRGVVGLEQWLKDPSRFPAGF
jgi:hypothetical protein